MTNPNKTKAGERTQPDRSDYKSDKGIAGWWPKDGAWHIARPGIDRFGKPSVLWTDKTFHTRNEAIAALEN